MKISYNVENQFIYTVICLIAGAKILTSLMIYWVNY